MQGIFGASLRYAVVMQHCQCVMCIYWNIETSYLQHKLAWNNCLTAITAWNNCLTAWNNFLNVVNIAGSITVALLLLLRRFQSAAIFLLPEGVASLVFFHHNDRYSEVQAQPYRLGVGNSSFVC